MWGRYYLVALQVNLSAWKGFRVLVWLQRFIIIIIITTLLLVLLRCMTAVYGNGDDILVWNLSDSCLSCLQICSYTFHVYLNVSRRRRRQYRLSLTSLWTWTITMWGIQHTPCLQAARVLTLSFLARPSVSSVLSVSPRRQKRFLVVIINSTFHVSVNGWSETDRVLCVNK